jgi:hypothetical protein
LLRASTTGTRWLSVASGAALTLNAGAGPVTLDGGANAVALSIVSSTITNNSTSSLTLGNVHMPQDNTPNFGGTGDIVISGALTGRTNG